MNNTARLTKLKRKKEMWGGEEEEGVAGLLTLASPSVMKKREEEKREAGSAEGSRYCGTEEGTGTYSREGRRGDNTLCRRRV